MACSFRGENIPRLGGAPWSSRPRIGRGATAIQSQRQAEGRAAAAQERGERRADDAIAAHLEAAAQAAAAVGEHDRVAETDRVGGEENGIRLVELKALIGRRA